ncbi:glycine cleavage system protein GcvH [Halanaeroarchaeum sulfurireducens]|uniref:Probable glycine cleavage system H protein n=1 Tax=Halanaeroarchaeum sulfurireducens TaxID=1604004 RepID=A0A0F7PF89_9EURY|nr:glycine cleavage system protein GcvH [Halanaeroarchaeum sulfurireducens]AKH98184.1 glycine cleavage system protein H [Halanaeroarchaeum sulfurireducens]
MSFDVPMNLYYRESHEWIDPETGRIGLSDYAQDELGDIVFVELPSVGDEIEAGEDFGVVESIKAVSDIYAPVSGEVTDVNERVFDEPELLNEDPYGDGWLVEVDAADEGELEDLHSGSEYSDQIE